MSRARIASLLVIGSLAVTAIALAAPQSITPAGVGSIHLGDRYLKLRKAGRVGKITTGCELAGPDARSARLLPPLKGFANLSFRSPRRITDVQITGGAAAKGVGIGDTLADIKAAFPKAKVDRSSEDVFAFTRVIVRGSDNRSLIAFAVDTATKKITLIGVPDIATCE